MDKWINIHVFGLTNLPLARLFENCWKQSIERTRHDFVPTPPPFRFSVSAYLISPHPLLPCPRESSSITDYTTAQEFDIVRPGASGKSRTGDCKLLCAVLDTFPVVYNPQRLVHEVNNLYLCMHCHALIFDAIQEDQTNNEFSWCTTGRWLSLQIKFVTFNALIINCMSSANS